MHGDPFKTTLSLDSKRTRGGEGAQEAVPTTPSFLFLVAPCVRGVVWGSYWCPGFPGFDSWPHPVGPSLPCCVHRGLPKKMLLPGHRCDAGEPLPRCFRPCLYVLTSVIAYKKRIGFQSHPLIYSVYLYYLRGVQWRRLAVTAETEMARESGQRRASVVRVYNWARKLSREAAVKDAKDQDWDRKRWVGAGWGRGCKCTAGKSCGAHRN